MAGGELTVFMAVPTLYSRLIEAYDGMPEKDQAVCSAAAKSLRLMVSGSAALPQTVMKRWYEITQHMLLERWGMTEIGMGLSNPLHPMSARIPGYVGNPMPSVDIKLVDTDTGYKVNAESGKSGELRVFGSTVFKEYWNNPKATAEAFDHEGWFKTGDVALFDPEKQSYRILGRMSQDIIKSGGYKISALEIEREILESPIVKECVVVGVEDNVKGERICAILVLNDGEKFDELKFKNWAYKRLAAYKVPSKYKILEKIPKNTMGKVSKTELVRNLFLCNVN